jgi:hypothetical protein
MSVTILRKTSINAVVKTGICSLVAALALVAVPSAAFADDAQPATENVEEPAPSVEHAYVRHGFTMELGLGISQTSVSSDVGAREHSDIGLAPLSIGLGGFLSPRLALIGRAAGTSTFRDDANGKSYQTVNGFYGPTLQYWATDRFYVGGGVGLAVLAGDPLGSKARDIHFLETGFGANARVGFAFALPGDHHALLLGVDAFGSKFEKSNTLAVALNLGWQFY